MGTVGRLTDWDWEKTTTQPIELYSGGGGIRSRAGLARPALPQGGHAPLCLRVASVTP